MTSLPTTQPTKTIHPEVLNYIPLRSALALLEVARDLRSGVIPKELFYMDTFVSHNACGTAYCIAGWAVSRLEGPFTTENYFKVFPNGMWANHLFDGNKPSNPQLAADVIERYIYENHPDPWLTHGTRLDTPVSGS